MGVQASRAGRCSNHIDNEAQFECVPCRRYLCNVCIKRVQLPNTVIDKCPMCGGLAQQIGALGQSRVADEVRRSQGHGPLISRLADAPAFLAKPSVLLFLLGLAVFEWLIGFAPFMVGSMIALGVEAWVYFWIVEQTANGKDDLDTPEFDHPVDDIFMPMFRYLVALLPLIIGVISFALEVTNNMRSGVASFEADPTLVLRHVRPFAIILAGLILWPLLTAIAAISKSIFDMLNPMVWVATLRNMGTDYFVGAVAFYVVLALEIFLWDPLLMSAAVKFQVPVVTSVGVLFLGYLPMALRARILGTMAAPYV